jgi:hypothetical protein
MDVLPNVRIVVYAYFDRDERTLKEVLLSDSAQVAELITMVRLVSKGLCLCEHMGEPLQLVADPDTLYFSICGHCLNLRDTTMVVPGIYNQIGFRMPGDLWSRLEKLRLEGKDHAR